MSDTWERLRAERVTTDWKAALKISLVGELAGQDELVDIVEEALIEAFERGKTMGAQKHG